MSEANTSICPHCGVSLYCGALSGDAACWCFDMPRVAAVPISDAAQTASCLCRNCLQQLIDSHAPKNLPAASD